MPTGYQGYAGYGDPERAKVDRARQLAELLSQGATDTSPKSFWEGAAQLGKAWIARGANERADAAESAYADKSRKLAEMFVGQALPNAADTPAPLDLTPGAISQTAGALKQGTENSRIADLARTMLGLGANPIEAVTGARQMADMGKPPAPTPYNLGNGAFGLYDPSSRKLEMLREAPQDAEPKAPEVNQFGQMWDGQKWVNIPGAMDNYGRMHPQDSGGPDKPPSGYMWRPDGTLTFIPGGPADPQRKGPIDPQTIGLEMRAGDKWTAIQKDFNDIRGQMQRMEALGSRKDSASDLGLIVSFTKMLDPGSVAREGEVKLTQSAAGLLDNAAMWLPRLQSGKTLLPDNVRQAYIDAARDMFSVYEDTYTTLGKDTAQRTSEWGLDPDRVMLGWRDPEIDKAKQLVENWNTMPAWMQKSNKDAYAHAKKLLEGQSVQKPQLQGGQDIDLTQLTPEQLDALEQQLMQGGG